MITLNNNDVRLAIKEYDDNSFDAIITDPPYEIGFNVKSWDSTGIAFDTELWKEALRVLKPGGHLVSFGASRTVHRLAVAIEDAGFEIRDQFNWLYTSGMTKGENLSRRIDKIVLNDNSPLKRISKAVVYAGVYGRQGRREKDYKKYEPLTQEGKDYDGYRVCLKPAFEPAVVARKPISEKTVAHNVVLYGTGAVNLTDNLVNGRQPANIVADDDYFESKAHGFLLQSKAPKHERIQSDSGNTHPTVKPVALMEHLVGLYTPRNGGRVLDMSAGSGSTLVACENLGKDAVGIEMSEEYCEIIRKRIENIVG